MTETAAYKKIESTDSKPLSKSVLPPTKFLWPWVHNEKRILIYLMIIFWGFIFTEFYLTNQRVSDQIKDLSPGYFGFKRDTHDPQWNAFRENLPLILMAASVHLSGSYLIKRFIKSSSEDKPNIILLIFHLVFGMDESVNEAPLHWHVMFNMTILRLMSFCIDYSWASRKKRGLSSQEHEKKCHTCNQTIICYRARQEAHSPLTNYNFLNYLTFLVYPALFISGPVTTFNAWISQIRKPQNSYSQKEVYKYVLRVLFNYICFEIFLHSFYVCAISTNPANEHIWQKFSLRELCLMSFLELFFLWFKFMLIWRIPRAWALLDGIEVPENMNRCICNNYTFEGFWRSWHRGFNQWLIRYLFIPLGGSKYKLYNIWVVFSFVALWHDMNINLVFWAWGICIALIPEMLLRWYFWLPKNRWLWGKLWWKYVCGMAGGFDGFLMLLANLVGFGIGWKGLVMVSEKFGNLQGVLTLWMGFVGFSMGILCQFMVRDKETDAEKGY